MFQWNKISSFLHNGSSGITGYFWRESRSYGYYVRRKNNRFGKQEFVIQFCYFHISLEHNEI